VEKSPLSKSLAAPDEYTEFTAGLSRLGELEPINVPRSTLSTRMPVMLEIEPQLHHFFVTADRSK
jgi:hypothetical protein